MTWEYRARPVRAIDGDTIVVHALLHDDGLDLGLTATIKVRVKDIDTPELRRGTIEQKVAGHAAKAFTHRWIKGNTEAPWPLRLHADRKRRSFDRFVAHIERTDGADLADTLVTANHATRV